MTSAPVVDPLASQPVADRLASSLSVDAGTCFGSHDATERLRVMHVINGEHYSGAERVQDLLALRSGEFGVDVEFACVKGDKFPSMRRSRETPLHSLRMSHKFDLRAVHELSTLARERQIDLLHAHTPRSAMIASGAAQLTGLPLVFHVHSPTSRDSTRRLTNWCNHLIERWSIRRAVAVLCVSDTLRDHTISAGIPAERVVTVANGVPCRDATKREPLSDGVPTIGTIALFRPRKGTEVLLDAIAELRRRGREVRLRAVGGFETEAYGRSLLERTASLGIEGLVEWTGFTREVDAELERLDLFALPSLFGEGMPMVVLEAMAAGLPTIASEVEGVPQVIEHGRHGLLVPPGEVAPLADAIERMLDDPESARSLGRAGRQRQQEAFSDRSMARGVADAYRRLTVGRRPERAARS